MVDSSLINIPALLFGLYYLYKLLTKSTSVTNTNDKIVKYKDRIYYYINGESFPYSHFKIYSTHIGMVSYNKPITKESVIRQSNNEMLAERGTKKMIRVSRNYLVERMEYLGNGN